MEEIVPHLRRKYVGDDNDKRQLIVEILYVSLQREVFVCAMGKGLLSA